MNRTLKITTQQHQINQKGIHCQQNREEKSFRLEFQLPNHKEIDNEKQEQEEMKKDWNWNYLILVV